MSSRPRNRLPRSSTSRSTRWPPSRTSSPRCTTSGCSTGSSDRRGSSSGSGVVPALWRLVRAPAGSSEPRAAGSGRQVTHGELGGAPVRGLRGRGAPPEEDDRKISWFAIFFGDFTPDFLAKFWVYGITINGHHYGATKPYQWHRGWPGMGISHTLFFGILVASGSGRGSTIAHGRSDTSSALPPTCSPT